MSLQQLQGTDLDSPLVVLENSCVNLRTNFFIQPASCSSYWDKTLDPWISLTCAQRFFGTGKLSGLPSTSHRSLPDLIANHNSP